MRSRWRPFIISAAVGLAASFAILAGVRSISGSTASSLKQYGPSCASQEPGQIAILARLAPGHTAAELAGAGFQVAPAIQRGDPGVVVLAGTDSKDAIVARLPGIAAVSQFGVVRAQSLDPKLRTCNYKLADSAGALAAAAPAKAAMVNSGLTTPSELEAPSTIFLVTDDPMNASRIFVAAVLAKADVQPGVSGGLTPIVATLDRHSLRVLNVGRANWYLGQ